VREFAPFGIHLHLQNWMPIVVIVAAVALVIAWRANNADSD